ncbi:12628_t:CDS:2 [Dentiscutata heterogama]|uniref:12628_t:CDS:1 n=1 Tax=Dentiscutata heterogama TaxID=1316150 RepID=A0ACA9JVZ4_9GLOM|nr:12628_t:CDS:2 [Dentiscutata heterogama]
MSIIDLPEISWSLMNFEISNEANIEFFFLPRYHKLTPLRSETLLTNLVTTDISPLVVRHPFSDSSEEIFKLGPSLNDDDLKRFEDNPFLKFYPMEWNIRISQRRDNSRVPLYF